MQKIVFIMILCLKISFLSVVGFFECNCPCFSMELNGTENLQKLKEFQSKKIYFPFCQEDKDSYRLDDQAFIGRLYAQNTFDSDIMSFHVVENIKEVDCILSTMSIPSYKQRLILMDLDQTLLFGSGLGWIDSLITQLIDSDHATSHRLDKLFRTYGFRSLGQFLEWGNATFPVPETNYGEAFFTQTTGVDLEVPKILQKWYNVGADIYGFTARRYFEDDVLSATQATLEADGINFSSLNRIKLNNGPLTSNFFSFFHAETGIIYNPNSCKFCETGIGPHFIRAYLEKLSENAPLPTCLEIIMIDDNNDVISSIVSQESIKAFRALQENFNVQIHIKVFKPHEWHWLSPREKWELHDEYMDNEQERKKHIQVCFDVLNEFLAIFRGS